MDKVSIVITTYNRPKLLRIAIKSALMQTYSNTEVIVVDGSSDSKTSEVIKYYKNKIVVVKDKKNIGVAAARNIGIKKSSGYYITFLDDDDIFHPKKIERQIKIFEKKSNIAMVYCPVATKINKQLIYKPLIGKNNHWIRLRFKNPIIMTPLIKNECLSICGVFDESLRYHEDRDLWYRIGKKFQFGFSTSPDYIWHNLEIARLSTQKETICKNKEKLYEKHKKDFENNDIYLSELHCEIANTYFLFKDYKKFFEHFKKSIEINPKVIPPVLKIYLKYVEENIDKILKISYKKEKIDKEIEKILSIKS
jgi:glycosyltransferase involved in cell wall biosynthesis